RDGLPVLSFTNPRDVLTSHDVFDTQVLVVVRKCLLREWPGERRKRLCWSYLAIQNRFVYLSRLRSAG
ncbi:MAG: hypothetical protein ROW39_03350, partial [Anaerolineaceae bacterium]